MYDFHEILICLFKGEFSSKNYKHEQSSLSHMNIYYVFFGVTSVSHKKYHYLINIRFQRYSLRIEGKLSKIYYIIFGVVLCV